MWFASRRKSKGAAKKNAIARPHKPKSFIPFLEPLETRILLDNDYYRVPGTSGQTVRLAFDWTERDSTYKNEIGVYAVQDQKGRVAGLLPTASGYAAAVRSQAQVVFASGESAGAQTEISFSGGSLLAFYLVQNNTTVNWASRNPKNKVNRNPIAFFSVDGASPDGFDHVHSQALANDTTRFSWEDFKGGGDRDFNDVIFEVSPARARILRVPGQPGERTNATFTWDIRSAAYNNEFGIFRVDDAQGKVGNRRPGDSGYAAAALASSRRHIVFASGQGAGAVTTLELPSGGMYGFYLVQNGTTTAFLARNPKNSLSDKPLVFFGFSAANPDHFDHMRWLSANQFAFEDTTKGGDRDFDDLVASVVFGTPPSTDNQAPAIAITSPTPNLATNSNFVVSGTTTDDNSGVASVQARINEGPLFDVPIESDGTWSFPTQLATNGSADGVYLIRARATDRAGNVSGFSEVTFTFDTQAPTVAFGATGANAAGWNNADVSLSYTTADNLSGVSSSNPGSPLVFSNEGANQTKVVTVTDVAGNSATYTSPVVNIDKTAPTATFGATGANAAGWNNADVSLTYTTADNLSGVSSSSPNSPLVFSNEGADQTQTVTVTDVAGNSATYTSPVVNIDKTAPTATFGATGANAAGWNNADVSLTYTTADNLSGVSSSSPSSPLNFSNEGANQTRTVTVTDIAGNSATYTSPVVNIDKTAPTVVITSPPPDFTTDTNVNVSGRVTDDLSQVSALQARVDQGGFFDVSFDSIGDFSFTTTLRLNGLDDGEHVVHLQATDRAGNVSGFFEVFFTLATGPLLHEGTSFRVSAEQVFQVPAQPSRLMFTFYGPDFDTSASGAMKDAFEVALLDSSGAALVFPFSPTRDAFFNVGEGQPAVMGAGTNIAGNTVSTDLSGLVPGSTFRLVFRLVNNDADTNTSVRLGSVQIVAGGGTAPPGVSQSLAVAAAQPAIDFGTLADVTASLTAQYARTSFNEEESVVYAQLQARNQGSYEVTGPLVAVVSHISDPAVRARDYDGLTPDGLPYYTLDDALTGASLPPEAATSSKAIAFYNPGSIRFDFELQFLAALNRSPVFTTEPGQQVLAGRPYVYAAAATDPDEDALTYALLVAPAGMTMDASTGVVSWTPAAADIGNHAVIVQVADGRGGSAEQSYLLDVLDEIPNRPPVFTSVPEVSANVNATYSYPAVAEDADGDTLVYSLGEMVPAPVSVFNPSFEAQILSDGANIGGALTGWTITGGGDAGVFNPQANQYTGGNVPHGQNVAYSNGPTISQVLTERLTAGTRYTLAVDVGDRLSTPLPTFSVELRAGGSLLAAASSPRPADMTFATVTITYETPANSPLLGQFLEIRLVTAGVQSNFDNVRLTAAALVGSPAGMAIDPATGLVTWTPTAAQFGTQDVRVRAEDGRGGAATQAYTILVGQAPGNSPPAIVSAPVIQINLGLPAQPISTPYSYPVQAIDADGDTLSYHLATGPAGMVIDPASGLITWPVPAQQSSNHPIDPRRTYLHTFSDPAPGSIPIELASLGIKGGDQIRLEVLGDFTLFGTPPEDRSRMTGVFSAGSVLLNSSSRHRVPGALNAGDDVVTGATFFGVEPTDIPEDVLIGTAANGGTVVHVPLLATHLFVDPMDVLYHDNADLDNDFAVRITRLPFYPVTVRVEDGRGGSDTQNFAVEVIQAAPAEIRGATFSDLDNSGTRDLAEPGLADWLIYLDQNDNGRLDHAERSATTDASGNYAFADLSPGAYTVALNGKPGAEETAPAGSTHLVILAAGQVAEGRDFGVVPLPDAANRPPSITGDAPAQATSGTAYRYQPATSDPDGDSLLFDLPVKPAGMAVDAATGVVAWTPTRVQVGSHDVILRVQDGRGGIDLQAFQITVAAPNTAPAITSTAPGPATLNNPYQYAVRAQDADGDAPTFHLDAAPAGMAINPSSGLVTWTPTTSQTGHALSFDGVDDSVVVPDNPSLTHSSLTLEAWVNPDTLSTGASGRAILAKYNSNNPSVNGVSWALTMVDTGVLGFSVYQDVAGSVFRIISTTGPALTAGAWQHVAATFDLATQQMKILVNGVEAPSTLFAGSTTVTGIADSNSPVRIGAYQNSVGNLIGLWDGQIDEVRIWSVVRSPAEIAADRQEVVGANSAGLAGYWRLNEGAGTTVADLTPKANHGVLGGGIVAQQPAWVNTTQAGHEVIVRVTDGRGGEATQNFTLVAINGAANRPPTISSNPRVGTRLGSGYLYQVEAADLDGDPLAYHLDAAPAGMVIDAHGLVTWEPTAAQLGDHAVVLRVADGRGGVANQAFTVTVGTQFSNRPPVITSTNPKPALTAGQIYRYEATGFDADGDPIFWSLDRAPAGMSIDPLRGAVRWQPVFDQLGSHEVILRLTDALGSSVTQTFTITVQAYNRPPNIVSTAPYAGTTGYPYTYDAKAVDPDGDLLTFSLLSGPTGMTINPQTGLVNWTPPGAPSGELIVVPLGRWVTGIQIASQELAEIRVDDGRNGWATQWWTIIVAAAPANHPPSITSRPPLVATNGQLYEYAAAAVDSEGDAMTFSLRQAPPGMTIDSTSGLVHWTPSAGQTGLHTVSVVATDEHGIAGSQTFSIGVAANTAPVIAGTPAPPATVTLGASYRHDVRATDAEGQTLTYTLTQAPAGMTIDSLGRIVWTPAAAQLGSHQVAVRVADPLGLFDSASFQVTVAADTTRPTVIVELSDNPAALNTPVTFYVSAMDDVGVAVRELTVNGVAIPLDPNGQATRTMTTSGAFTVVATARDAAGNFSTATTTLEVIDPSDVNAPFVSLNLPDETVFTAPTGLIGTVTDPNLQFYTLEIALVGSGDFREIFRGTTQVVNAPLATFDPTLLSNDSYVLRLAATDDGGNTSLVESIIHVAGNLKLGNFTLSFTDLTVPVSGIPISVTRTYDTLTASSSGDFGYGWRLEFRDMDLRTSVRPTGAEADGFFNPLKFGSRVYLTLPGGERQAFTFKPKVAAGIRGSFLGIFEPHFEPDPGVTSSLAVTPADLRINEDSEVLDYGTGIAYNPASGLFGGSYLLTTKDGIAFEINGETGLLTTLSDPNNNVLTFSDGGITSSTGAQVIFERDPQGRITAVIDPAGQRIRYRYDARGDLVAVTDRLSNTTQFVYRTDHAHYLDQVIDPLGRTGMRTDYDADGRLTKVFDAAGNAVQFAFDPANSVATVRDQLGNPTTYEYDPRGNVVREIDALGGIIRRTFDADNNMLTLTDQLGRTSTFTYTDRGDVLTATDPLGNTTRSTHQAFTFGLDVYWVTKGYAQAPFTRVTTSTDPLGNTTQARYDFMGNLVAQTDALGNLTTILNDAAGNPTVFTDPLGNVTRNSYDAAGNNTQLVDANGHVTNYTHDANGNLLSQTQGEGSGWSLAYNAEGLPTSLGLIGLPRTVHYDAIEQITRLADPSGQTAMLSYDALGNLSQFALADGTVLQSSTYDAVGNIVSVTDSLGNVTRYAYNAVHRLVQTTYADGSTEKRSYNLAGELVELTDALGYKTRYVYDDAGRQIQVIDALSGVSSTQFDAAGRVVATTDPLGRTTRFQYDANGQQVATLDPDGSTTRTVYNASGRLVQTVDAVGGVTTFGYDSVGKLVAVTDALGNVTRYQYGDSNERVAIIDARGNTTRFDYDTHGRLIQTTQPEGETDSSTYDSSGRLASTTNGNGQTIHYGYDVRGQLASRTLPDGSQETHTYTADSLMSSVSDANGTTHYDYDPVMRRLVRVTEPDGRYIRYAYDARGARTLMAHSMGAELPEDVTQFAYDALGRLVQVTDPQGGVTTFAYDAAGNLTTTTLPNGVSETSTYDTSNHLIAIVAKNSDGATLSGFSYTLDVNGNRSREDHADGSYIVYAYDALNRVTAEQHFDINGLTMAAEVYSYDVVGNLTSRSGTLLGNATFSYNRNDQLVSGAGSAYIYDAAGNLVSVTDSAGNVKRYGYDARGRLVSSQAPDGTVTTYTYDFRGTRQSQQGPGGLVKYLVDAAAGPGSAQVVRESDSTGATLRIYVIGPRLLSFVEGSNVRYYLRDALGSTRLLTDQSGAVTDSYSYSAYGELLGHLGGSTNPIRFAGEQQDASGLVYLRARYYDPATGRFLSRDAFPGFNDQPLSLNKYLYALANPVNYTDPSGNFVSLLETAAALGVQSALKAVDSVQAAIKLARALDRLYDSLQKIGGVMTMYAWWGGMIDPDRSREFFGGPATHAPIVSQGVSIVSQFWLAKISMKMLGTNAFYIPKPLPPDKTWLAWVNVKKASGTVNLGPMMFTLPIFPTGAEPMVDTQLGTLVHEFTHLASTGTLNGHVKDHGIRGYGRDALLLLPHEALFNAENYMHAVNAHYFGLSYAQALVADFLPSHSNPA